MNQSILRIISLLTLLCLVPAPGLAGDRIKAKACTVVPQGTPWEQAIKAIIKHVRKDTAGRVKVKVYWGGAKGSEVPEYLDLDAAAIEAELGWGDSSKSEGHKLIDNSWEALRAKGHTYADKAQERLGPVKGKDFRKQMTKAKRGTYMCGAIDGNAVNSIKYPDSD